MGQCYRQLTLEERRTDFRLRAAKASVEAIANWLGRHRPQSTESWPGTRSRTPIRTSTGTSRPVAHDAAARRRQRLGKLHRDPKLSPM
jgi:IS30 family transposase